MRILRGVWVGLMAAATLAVPLLVSSALVGNRDVTARAAWLVAGVLSISIFAKIAMAMLRPANLEMRRQPPIVGRARKQPVIDAVGLVAFLTYLVAWMAFIPADTGRFHLLPPPPVWSMDVGFAAAIVGLSISHLAVWQNVFATPAIQEQAGQRVIDTGLYGLIRHPLYAGNLLFFTGTALWMGSLAAPIGVGVILAATLARIVIEERYLREHLPDYPQYVRRVRARLIPFLI